MIGHRLKLKAFASAWILVIGIATPVVGCMSPGRMTKASSSPHHALEFNESVDPKFTASHHPEILAIAKIISANWNRSMDSAISIALGVAASAIDNDINPEWLLGIIAVESSFIEDVGNPGCHIKVCEKTDYSKPHGLMQISAKWHGDKFSTPPASADINEHIRVGGLVLREYLNRYGNISKALQAYNGNLADHKMRYAEKVMREAMRFRLTS